MTTTELLALTSDGLAAWLQHMRAGRREDARQSAEATIDACRSLLRSPNDPTQESLRNQTLAVGVLFRGLQDFCLFRKVVEQQGWYKDTDSIEQAWIHMWDARERLEFASTFCENEIAKDVLAYLESFETAVNDVLGPGIYISPEILVDTVSCSICGADYRTCEHIAGTLYDGQLCTRRPHGMSIYAVALVTEPVDPRCRAWPWHLEAGENENDNKLTACLMRVFSLTDFMDEGTGEA